MGNCLINDELARFQNPNFSDLSQQLLFISDYSELLDKQIHKEPTQVCSSGNTIQRFCYNETCDSSAMCCISKQCKICHSIHLKCPTIRVKQLNQLLAERLQDQKTFFTNMFNIQNELISRLIQNRKELIARSKFWKFQGSSFEAFESIYQINSTKGLKGKQIKALFNQLLENKKGFEIDQYLQSQKMEWEQILYKLEKIRKNIIQSLDKGKKKVQSHKFPSKILSEDKQGKQKWAFLTKQLNNPTSLKLLFRASQHNFAASKFHEYCDGISDTVTIIRTEFGKTIAAYTPLKWSYVQGDVADNSSRSFLLQLELKQKMTLTQPQYAICNHKDYGPRFGWNDLCIADQSNENQNSYSSFPFSYNCKGKYQKNQQSYTAFCGNPKGFQFKVCEWQVLAVVK